MSARIAFLCLTLAIGSPAAADELADKLCPILRQISAEMAGKVAVALQADMVLAIGTAYDFDDEALRNVTDNIDASASANCAVARDAILKQLQMQSLREALR